MLIADQVDSIVAQHLGDLCESSICFPERPKVVLARIIFYVLRLFAHIFLLSITRFALPVLRSMLFSSTIFTLNPQSDDAAQLVFQLLLPGQPSDSFRR